MAELKAFDESKAGVKGLVDSGIKEIPRIFHAPPHFLKDGSPFSPDDPNFKFPIIDLSMVHDPVKRKETVDQIRNAAESWGFFLIVNHGVPKNIQDEMKAGVHGFFDLDLEQKKEFYDREQTKEIVPKYTSEMNKLGDLLFQLLSEGLGLESNHLKDMGCPEAVGYAFHYYPPCPQPELALGCVHHTDIDFLTVILQDQVGGFVQDEVGGLQVLHHNSWIDVPYIPGALVVNIGDMLQLISNDKFISALHRVKAQKVGPRVSNATFFGHGSSKFTRLYGPIKELVSEKNPPKYKEITIRDFYRASYEKGVDGTSILPRLKLDNNSSV
ncbi:1-aminocyclopropane-1-carboxylate oxidase homolog 1 [Linum perenne]